MDVEHSRSQGCWRCHPVDGGLLAFRRQTGTNVLYRGISTRDNCRAAPRVLQVGLLTSCNLRCGFCYRDTEVSARLDQQFLVDLLTEAFDWGVLEVAFGGGEPLMYPGFIELLRELRQRTELGLNITTNGTLITPEIAMNLIEATDEIRVSALTDNGYRRTIRLLQGHNVGVNLLVTPANVGMVESCVRDALILGAQNVLLLGYKGNDPKLHLGIDHLNVLRRTVLRLQHLPLRLDACWYPLLSDLPHLFARSDCGAGEEVLVINPGPTVQPCSFHHERIPFETIEDLKTLYHDMRKRRPPTPIGGCTRRLFIQSQPDPTPPDEMLCIWDARASNNSGDWTIIGRFRTVEEARKAAESLRELARAHEAFLASPEGQQWLQENDYYGNVPSPPLRLFGESHGFDWTTNGEGLWWEEDGCGAPVLTAGAVGASIVVYHPYCMGLPERPFKEFFTKVGALEFGYWQYDRPAVVARAKGNNPSAIETLSEYLAIVDAAEYPSEVEMSPPWGSLCEDPRVLDDEDRSARLARGCKEICQEGDQLQVALAFENTFAGSLALENWLRAMGYEEIEIEIDDVLAELLATGQTRTVPKRGLFGDVRPLTERLRNATPEKIVELVFGYHSDAPTELEQAFKAIPPALRLELCSAYWERSRAVGRDVTWQAVLVIRDLGPIAAEWMRVIWQEVITEGRDDAGFATKALAASLPPDEAFELARFWAESAADREVRKERLMALGKLAHRGTLGLIESWWESADPGLPVTEEWGRLAADSRLTWAITETWLQRGRPLALIALDTLLNYLSRPGHYHVARPADFGLRNAEILQDVLMRYRDRDRTPRVSRIADVLITNAESFMD